MEGGDHGPELSSLSTALGELTARITAIAERCAGTEADPVAQELFAVERSLGEALRRLEGLDTSSPPRSD